MATCCEGRRKAPALLKSAIVLGVVFSLAAVPRRVQPVVNAEHPAGEILFHEWLLPDICRYLLWRNDLLFTETLLFDKAAKSVQFTLRQFNFGSEREKADLLAAPNQSRIILGDLDSPIQRPKVGKGYRVRELIPPIGVSVGKVPHALL